MTSAAIAFVSLAVLLRFKLHEPLVVLAAGLAGVALWPVVQAPAPEGHDDVCFAVSLLVNVVTI